MNTETKDTLNQLRGKIGDIGKDVKALLQHPDLHVSASTQFAADVESKREAGANVMLAFRHLEDARVRVGKVINALDGGVSVYEDSRNDGPGRT